MWIDFLFLAFVHCIVFFEVQIDGVEILDPEQQAESKQIRGNVKLGRDTLLVYEYEKSSLDVINEILDYNDKNIVLQSVDNTDIQMTLVGETDWLILDFLDPPVSLIINPKVIIKRVEVVEGNFIVSGTPIEREVYTELI